MSSISGDRLLHLQPEDAPYRGNHHERGEIGWGGMDWIDLAQDRDQWKAFASTIMNLRVAENIREILQ
jgi:hypothetical protein